MRFSELLKALPDYLLLHRAGDPEIGGLTDDSRAVQPGDAFIAVTGGTFDGHAYVERAIAAGAGAVFAERTVPDVDLGDVPYVVVPDSREALGWLHALWQGFPADGLTLIGVTGTDGKTTTTNLIHAMLEAAGLSAGMISTVNARIGGESLDTGLHTTTPPADEIQKLLARMVAYGSTHAVLEVTSHGLAQHRVAGCEFDVAVITNITHEHLDHHGTWDAYVAAKSRLFRGLTAQRRKDNVDDKIAVLNRDDASLARLISIPVAHQLLYGVEREDVDVSAREVRFTPHGLRFALHSPWGKVPIASPLVGRFNVSNILAAASACLGMGLSLAHVAEGVRHVTGIPGRMETIDAGQDFLAIVDFAHTPNALRHALEAARTMVAEDGRVIVVFGSAGLRDREKRWMMGEVAGDAADFTVATAEDPRTESLNEILAEMALGLERAGAREGEDYILIPDRGAAILAAVQMAQPGDVVMACGKGHEQSMCFGTTEYPWDDREAMRLALAGKTLTNLPTADPDWHN